MYHPPGSIADPPSDARASPLSGSVAGVYARTDASRGVWKAPAGLDAVLLGVHDVAVHLQDTEISALEAAGVNAVRAWPQSGQVLWGARTIQGADAVASEFKYVPVRRLCIFIEDSIERGTRWAMFEPNDEPLWAALRLAVGVFLHGLCGDGAFAGTTPQEAYFVRCDRSTMTQDDLDEGVVRMVIGVAPLRPAEFVVLEIGQRAGGVATEQLGTGHCCVGRSPAAGKPSGPVGVRP